MSMREDLFQDVLIPYHRRHQVLASWPRPPLIVRPHERHDAEDNHGTACPSEFFPLPWRCSGITGELERDRPRACLFLRTVAVQPGCVNPLIEEAGRVIGLTGAAT